MLKAFLVKLVLLAVCVPGAGAENPAAAFDAANKLYEQGKYSEAASTYEKLIQSGPASVALYFNLGNALFKSGQIGRAVAAYRQAQQLAPHDSEVRANLQFARNQTQRPTLAANYSQRVLRALSLNEWTVLAASAVWILFLLLAFLQWRPALKRTLRGFVLGLTVAAVILCCCLGVAFYEHRFTRMAVVIARDTAVHNGPLEESANAFTVHDGAELRVLDQKDEWLQVSTDPRRIGWLRRDQVLFLPRT